jgi:hypothetical protein
LIDAELLTKEIEDLKEEELVAKTAEVLQRNHGQFQQLRKIQEEQLARFEDQWNSELTALEAEIKNVDQEFLVNQKNELKEFDSLASRVEVPPIRYSSSILNNQVIYSQLVKNKK